MALETIRLYNDPWCSLERDTVTGAAVLAVDIDMGAASGVLYYQISEDELALFLADENALAAFVVKGQYGLRERRTSRLSPHRSIHRHEPVVKTGLMRCWAR